MDERLSIIMLEDNPDDAAFIKKTLLRSTLQFEAKVVFTPGDFINALKSAPPDVVLSDHQLPQFNSREALEICKEISPFIPFILVTGTASEEFAASIIKAGADDYILKNNLKRLPTAIEQAIERKKKKTQRLVIEMQREQEFEKNNLTALINNTEDLMWSIDRDFRLITCNQAFIEMVKYITGKDAKRGEDSRLASSSKEQSDRFAHFYERAFEGETFTEIEYTPSPEVWSEISFNPIRKDGEIVGTACFSRNITERKREEIRLKLLESVITQATEGVIITEAFPLDEPGPRIIYVNNAQASITGYSKEELIGKTPRIFQGPKTDTNKLAHLRRCMERLESCEVELLNYKKNGESFWVSISVSPVLNNDGIPTHFIAIQRDVTERLNNVQAIQEQNKKLRDIAWMQSHDVRGPLARIMGLINIIQNHSEGADKQEVINYLIASANDLDAVIKKIVDLSEEVE